MRLSWPCCVVLTAVTACSAPPPAPVPAPAQQACSETGTASWYHGSRKGGVAPNELVAAHPSLPFGTLVHVTAVDGGQSVVVRINDRGPFAKGRIIDLSEAAARQLGFRKDGVMEVRLDVDTTADVPCPLREARLETG